MVPLVAVTSAMVVFFVGLSASAIAVGRRDESFITTAVAAAIGGRPLTSSPS
jgi:hypothetical protein